ncbi:MAG: tetratricopeptide repeat protein, partial [Candidatus Sulfotelmatobacter sp.]
LESWAGFNYQNWQTAAKFCADNKINLEEALQWSDKAINGPFRGATIAHEDFSTLATKAAVLDAMGRDSEADALIERALHLPGTDAYPVYAYGMGLLGKGNKDKAMKIFALNRQQHPQDKFWTSLGLARGYTAIGDKTNAIVNWEVVVQNVPSNLSNRTAAFEASLKKLKETS